MRGLFIVFEGCHASGKTLFSKKMIDVVISGMDRPIILLDLNKEENGVCELITRELNGGCVLTAEAVELLNIANLWESKHKILKIIEEGVDVVCDGYVYAMMAKTGLLWKHPTIFNGLPKPDIVFYLHSPLHILETRSDPCDNLDHRTMITYFNSIIENTWYKIDTNKIKSTVICDIIKIYTSITAEKPIEMINM